MTLATNRNPNPKPKHTPWPRSNCQNSFANEEPMREIVSKKTPNKRTKRLLKYPISHVAIGAMSRAIETLRPPTRAYATAEVPGKTLWVR